MDWSKAKNVLIIAFIIMNILLAHTIYKDAQENTLLVDEDLVEKSIKLLGEKNIGVKGNIPRERLGLNPLLVQYEIGDIERLNDQFFKGKGNIYYLGRGIRRIKYKDEEVLYEKGKKFTYIYIGSNKGEKSLNINSKEDQIKICKKFLIDKGFDTKDMVLTSYSRKKDKRTLVFSKLYKGNFIEESYTKFTISKFGIESVERVWLEVVKEGENLIYVESAPKSILELLSMEEAYGKDIESIDLCYHFDFSEYDEYKSGRNTYEVRSGRAMPTWRIQLNNGDKIIIDNY